MTYLEASTFCAVNRLTGPEERAYTQLLTVLDVQSASTPINLFPLLMHFLSDAMAAQIAQESLYTREGRIVTLTEEVLGIVRQLVTAKCVLAGSLPEDNGV